MKRSFFLSFALFSMFLIACEKDPVVPNEEELITTVTYELTPVGGGNTVTLSFQDLDGDGGDTAIILGGVLETTTTYNGVLTLLNESESPAEDITVEIQNEAEEHQFFFVPNATGVSVAYGDQDANGNPIGLSTVLTTGTAASGNITITLKHEPDKFANNVAAGDITNAGGETDIEVSFPIDVQ